MCGEISQTTTSEIVEVANSAASRSKLQELLPVYFYSWQLQNLEAVIINLLLNYFVLWRDGSDMRRDRQAFEEHIARLKNRVAELEENREPDQEINKLMKKAQDLVLQNERLQKAHDEVSVCVCHFFCLYVHRTIVSLFHPVCVYLCMCAFYSRMSHLASPAALSH